MVSGSDKEGVGMNPERLDEIRAILRGISFGGKWETFLQINETGRLNIRGVNGGLVA